MVGHLFSYRNIEILYVLLASRFTDYASTERRLVNPAALLGSGSLIRYESVLEALSGRSVEK